MNASKKEGPLVTLRSPEEVATPLLAIRAQGRIAGCAFAEGYWELPPT